MGEHQAARSRVGALVQEVAKFGAVGGAGVFVNLAVFNLGRHYGRIPVIRASVIATLISIAFNYVGFKYFAYRGRGKGRQATEITFFLGFSLIGLLIENGVLYTATYALGWDSELQGNVFKFLGIGLATLFRFWSYRTWVFKSIPKRENAA